MMNSNLSPYIPNSNQITVLPPRKLAPILTYSLSFITHFYTFPKIYLIYFYINLYNYKYQDRWKIGRQTDRVESNNGRIKVTRSRIATIS